VEYASSVYLDPQAKLDDGTLVTSKSTATSTPASSCRGTRTPEKAKDSLLNHMRGRAEVAYPGPLDIHESTA